MIELKPATPADAKILTELARKVFTDTFAKDNLDSDMNLYLDSAFVEAKQLAEINDSKRHSIIARMEGQPAGFYQLLKDSREECILGPAPLELLRLYVDSKWHGKGVAKALMENAIEFGRTNGFQTFWLGVWENNLRAQAFYRKFGFQVKGSHVFVLGTDPQNDLIMARDL